MAVRQQREMEFIDGFPFFGGRLWLDLVNSTRLSGPARRDLIERDDRFEAWLRVAGLLPPDGSAKPGEKERLLSLREKLRGAVDSLRAGDPPPASLVADINAILAAVSIRLSLEEHEGGYYLVEHFDAGEAGPLGPVAADFSRFLKEAETERLRRCSNPACTMVFYDTSKNNTRRWCSMSLCGNRDKVARFRARKASS